MGAVCAPCRTQPEDEDMPWPSGRFIAPEVSWKKIKADENEDELPAVAKGHFVDVAELDLEIKKVDDKLGVALVPDGAVQKITSIHRTGLIYEWNQANGSKVKEGDCIVEVNGVQGNAHFVSSALSRSKTLKIKVQRYVLAPVPVVAEKKAGGDKIDPAKHMNGAKPNVANETKSDASKYEKEVKQETRSDAIKDQQNVKQEAKHVAITDQQQVKQEAETKTDAIKDEKEVKQETESKTDAITDQKEAKQAEVANTAVPQSAEGKTTMHQTDVSKPTEAPTSAAAGSKKGGAWGKIDVDTLDIGDEGAEAPIDEKPKQEETPTNEESKESKA
eukprot:gnl/MRDRNA2_/MRDRNA2_93103_c0_seq1.p1 gnl/MRDRNA2_/MRDRNA2_93103_c0~~gnl/MRDRNA2_/MRDRNA2_93103_c0_seq1.p1  ORF type:complete len:332 (+),score=109.08 gnl/MRDRNA2_/MRDRNA2_93103_c0_seq1:143-1138(+)